MRIDHVIWAAADLESATAALEQRLGITRHGGGRHDGLGTHNTILPLGGGYLEVLAIADAEEAETSPLGKAVQQRLAHGDGLMGWALLVDDVDAVADRLGTPIVELSRKGFSARLTGVGEAAINPSRPFFLTRGEGTADPGDHGEADGISWVEVAADREGMDAWLGRGHGVPVRYASGIGRGVTGVGLGEADELR